MVKQKAVFFDRDGTLNHLVDNRAPWTFGEFKFIDGATEAVRLVKDLGYLTFVVTNQPDVKDDKIDVFSSFKIYGWDEMDKQFEPLYDEIREHPNMTYHGFVPNNELKEHLNKSHIFAYPSTWVETSCRAMLEAMSAGLVCVHPNYGALAETSGSLNIMYQGNIDKGKHANVFVNHLNAAIEFVKSNNHKDMINFNKTFVDSRYNIQRIKGMWELMMKNLLDEYKEKESRGKPSEVFVYDSQ
jgi:glycosyltransferase involved in cell wall biosynthesis